jgi:predicted enzyme related to lactoylglutathione lyase
MAPSYSAHRIAGTRKRGDIMPDYAPGTPAWVDLSTPDLAAAQTFYAALFGWDPQVVPEPGAGGYTMFNSDGKAVAGGGPTFSPEQPAAWATYVSVVDADATAQKVREAGGQVVMEPFDVMSAGRMAVFTDPQGAFISIWQPREHQGAEKVNENYSLGWNELYSRDVEGSKRFYGSVFGWGAKSNPMDGGGTYTEWQLGGKSIGGMFEMTENFPAGVPPHWLAYFVVPNVDAAASLVQDLGGTIMVPARDIEPGRFAVVNDPQGAMFALFAFKKAAAS